MASSQWTRSEENMFNGESKNKRINHWTENEHKLFLLGLDTYGKGDWKSISRNVVVTRTPTQVASHAQKYFLRQNSVKKVRKRPSIHDITTVDINFVTPSSNMDWTSQHQTPIQSQQQQQQQFGQDQNPVQAQQQQQILSEFGQYHNPVQTQQQQILSEFDQYQNPVQAQQPILSEFGQHQNPVQAQQQQILSEFGQHQSYVQAQWQYIQSEFGQQLTPPHFVDFSFMM